MEVRQNQPRQADCMSDQPDNSGVLVTADRQFRNRVLRLPRTVKQFLMITADFAGLIGSVWIAFWLLFPAGIANSQFLLLSAMTYVVAVSVAAQQRFYHSIVRYVGMDLAVSALVVAVVSGAALCGAAIWAESIPDPIRLAIAYSALCLLYMLGSRYTARYYLSRRSRGRERVVVYGAGEAGARLVLSMQGGDSFFPVALVDDNKSMHGKRVGGLPVLSRNQLDSLVSDLGVTRVLLALPSASRRHRAAIIDSLEPLPVHVQTIPDLNDLVTGRSRVDDIRDVAVEDLLGRDAVPPNKTLLKKSIRNKNVMVTGAGGSIGSELCRQVIRLKPKTLVLFELSEVALYNIEKELSRLSRKLELDCEIIALLGSVHHQDRVSEIMLTFEINTVYHAAAYKHVPVVEQNILEGVHNNIFGTLHTARAAAAAKVETFVLVSTDKAVSPTNVMGATKRFAELVLQAIQSRYPDTCFCMVRFGNVLESSGSVVPLFREQIRAGGPVTVTHRDIIRYFMTIPEAAQLVIQASAMARGGDVFVLDMGDPVKIQDLARRMINLMGLSVRDSENPDGDIEIEYTGLRPAEKLYEELLIGKDVSGTSHPRIMRANEEYLEAEALIPLIDELRLASKELDRDRVRNVLMQSVHGYAPTNGIDDLVWVRSKQPTKPAASENIVEMKPRSA